MIIEVKHKADFDTISAAWGLLHFIETETDYELYIFKWGIAYLYKQRKSELEDHDSFRSFLVDHRAIEMKEITDAGIAPSREIEDEFVSEDMEEDNDQLENGGDN